MSAILDFLEFKFSASSSTCFSSKVNGEAIAKALIISLKLCFSKAFQLIINPFFSNRSYKSLKINSRSENFKFSFFSSKSSKNLLKFILHKRYFLFV